MKSSIGSVFLAALLLTAPAAFGAENGFFISGAIGQAEWEDDCFNALGRSVCLGTDSDVAFGINGGYSFNQYVAIEGGYQYLGETDVSVSGTSVDVPFTVKGLTTGVVGTLPVSDRLKFYGKTGILLYELEVTSDRSSPASGFSVNGTDAYAGLGMRVATTENLDLGLEYVRYGSEDVGLYFLGVSFRVGF
ncbi:MAG: outer membrane beta-barrel protein [Pseudomonadales bacterium]